MVKTQEKYFNTEYHPSGVLAFIVDHYPNKEWKDNSQLIENRLLDIIKALAGSIGTVYVH